MTIIQLKKPFRLVWNAENQIIIKGEFPLTSVTGCLKEFSFEADSEEEINSKIQELELIEIEDNL